MRTTTIVRAVDALYQTVRGDRADRPDQLRSHGRALHRGASLEAEIALQLGYLNALEGPAYSLGDELSGADVQLSIIGELAAGSTPGR